jgi:hypothetical protein
VGRVFEAKAVRAVQDAIANVKVCPKIDLFAEYR